MYVISARLTLAATIASAIKHPLLTATLAASLLTGCLFTASPGHVGLTVVPALPVVVELQDDPYFYHGGYFYYYQGDQWSYATRRSGPWSSLPRDRYPREVRYTGRYQHPAPAPAWVDDHGRDAGRSRGKGHDKSGGRGHGGEDGDKARGPN